MIALLLAAQLAAGITDGLVSTTPTPWCAENFGGYCTWARDYGSDDVGKAMAICDRHSHSDGGTVFTVIPPVYDPIIQYNPGWEACTKVREAWAQSESARKEREAQEQEQRDLDFVKGVAEKQK